MVSRYPLCRTFVATLVATLVVLTFCFGWVSPAQATSYDRQSLRNTDWSNQDLRGNNYTSADMADADMSHSDLRGVRLFDTTLARANMAGANMSGATLDSARFYQANLTNAILEGAYVFGTDFREATIDGADFTDVLLDPKVNKMLCEVATGTNPVTGRNTRDTLYCF